MKVVNEDKAVENRTNELMSEWAREKPTAGNMRPDAAAKQLALMETKLAKLKEERAALRKAREALEMSDLGVCVCVCVCVCVIVCVRLVVEL